LGRRGEPGETFRWGLLENEWWCSWEWVCGFVAEQVGECCLPCAYKRNTGPRQGRGVEWRDLSQLQWKWGAYSVSTWQNQRAVGQCEPEVLESAVDWRCSLGRF
jgi:hypothetical protein